MQLYRMKRTPKPSWFLLGTALLFAACAPEGNNRVTFDSDLFRQCDTLPAQVLAKELRIHYPASMFAIDSVIGIVDFRTSDFFIHLYNEKGEALGNMARKGRGFGEITNYNDFLVKKEEGLVSFYSPGKITEYDVRAFLADSADYIKVYPVPSKAYHTSNFYHNALRIGTDKYLLVESFDLNRFVMIDGRTCRTYTAYPEVTGEGTEKDAAIFRYASKMAIKGDYSRIAFGTYIGGVLEILQIDDRSGISPVKTVGVYEPVYAKVKNSPDAITWGDETTIGFEAMDATDKYLYTLLNGASGKELKAEDAIQDPPFTENISIFDWDGEAVKQIHTGKKLMAIAAKGDSVCYAVAYDDNYSLLKMALK